MSSRKLSAGYLFYCAIVALFIIGICFSAPARGQVAGGTLSGTITDPSEKYVPQAQVSIRNVATGITTTVTTNSDGFYIAANLLPGDYQITISAKGFDTETKSGIRISVGSQQVFDLALRIGAISNKVEVSTDAPAIQTSSSEISATVNATTVRELPLNGRSWTDLAALQPGVDTIQTQPTFAVGADRGNRGFGQQLTISGARPQQNNYRLDGVSINDYANGAPGSVLGGNLGVDAIQEFSVLTSNYSAEYGKTSGGVVNAITRSGTNGLHGSVYEFLRNSALDARNFFDGAKIPSFKRNQFGGAIGGPIINSRTFFFADYEGIRQSKGITAVTTVPSLDARNGKIHDSKTGNPITVAIDPKAQQYLDFFYHLPNGPTVGNGDVAKYSFAGQQVVNENFFTTRLDHKFSEKDNVSGTYLYDKTAYTSPDGVNNVLLGSKSSRQIAVLEETHLFRPNFANTVRFGYNYEVVDNNQGLQALVPKAADTSLGTFPGRTAPQVFISGMTPFSGGVAGLSAYFYHWNSFQAYDDAFVNKGKHAIKFGGTVERMLLNIRALSDPNGIFKFGSLQSFYANNPGKFQGGIASTLSPRNLRQTLFGLYLQDDWRWKSNLTLNLGLRYEITSVPTETNGKIAVLRNLSDTQPVCGVAVTGCAGTGPFFNNPTTKNFEPRVGFAWDPLRNGKMAIRGGAGLFDVLPLPYQFTLLTTLAAPFFQYTSINNPGTGTFFNSLPASLPANKLRATYIDPSPKRNYVTQWNLNIQYQLMQNLTAMVAYVGSRGVHQPYRLDDASLVIPTLTSAGYLWPQVDADGNLMSGPNAGKSPSRNNEGFGSVRGMFYQGRSYYNALETQLAKRMSHGFQMQGTFTWGKSIDTSSATVAGDAFGNSISSLQFAFDPKLSRALSDFSIGRTLVLNGTWEVPSPKSFSGAARWLSDGWQLGVIFTASDGVPFTPTWGTGDDPAGTLSSDDWAFPNRLGSPGCKSLTNPGNANKYIKTECFAVPTAPNMAFWAANCDPEPPTFGGPLPAGDLRCFNLRGNAGRNIMIGPGITSLDFSVFKNNHIRRISENFNVQFRAEIFNILNHANFAPPTTPDNSDIFDSSGADTGVAGLLSRTTTTAREIQFAIKIIF